MIDGLQDKHRLAILNVLSADKRVERVVLFGSRAKGTFTSGSDVDIALFGDELAIRDQSRLVVLMEELTVPQRVDLLLYNRIEDKTLRTHIQRDGIEWYRSGKQFLPDHPLNLPKKHRQMLEALLRDHLSDVEAWAYSSRVNGSRNFVDNDLDLVLRGPNMKAIPNKQLRDFRNAIKESSLPFSVEVWDWVSLPKQPNREIKWNRVVVKQEVSRTTWRKVSIDEIADIVGGGTPSTKNSNNFEGDIPWLTPKDLSGTNNRYVRHGKRNLSQQGLDNSSAKLLPAGSVLLSTRAPIGYVALAENPIATNRGFRSLVVRDDVLPEYLYYWLKLNTEELKRYATGSTFREISGSSLKKIQLSLPPLREQRTIAHILGTLDDKIELNRSMNNTLEAMAQALFRSWFVDFDPVRAKMEGHDTGLPQHIADLFPDNLVESDLGKIPEGWSTNVLGIIATSPKKSVNPDNLHDQTPYIGLKHMPRQSIALEMWGSSKEVISNKLRFKKGDFLFGKISPHSHKIGIAPINGICSTDIVVVSPYSSVWSAFLLLLLSSVDFVDYTSRTSTGTIMSRTSWKTMSQYPLCLPPESVASVFQNVIGPMLDRILANTHINRFLMATLDALLPKLISGELKTRDLLKQMEIEE